MSSRPTGGVEWVRFALYQDGDMKESSNDFWYSVTAGTISSATDFKALCQAFLTNVAVPLSNVISAGRIMRGCVGWFNNGVGTYSYALYQNVPGLDLADPIEEDVAVVVRKETATPGRKSTGRWYITGIGSEFVQGSYLTPAGQTALLAPAVAFKTEIVAGGITLSPAHFSPSTGLLYAITNTPVIALLGTERRRRGVF